MVQSFERASGVKIPYQILPRRDGDLPAFWADANLARKELGWEVRRGIDDMMRDTWNWQKNNPQGYRSKS